MKHFQLGDVVLYGSNGVCKISKLDTINDKNYYILVPIHKAGTKVLIPTDSEQLIAKMRMVPTKEVLLEQISMARDQHMNWITENTARHDDAKRILSSGEEVELILLVRAYTEHRKSVVNRGKRVSSTDAIILRNATERLRDEFSYVLSITTEEVDNLIASL